MSDWGQAADLQEQQHVQQQPQPSVPGDVPNIQPQQASAGNPSTSASSAAPGQLPSFFTDGPLSKPFFSPGLSWDMGATNQEHGESGRFAAPAVHASATQSPAQRPPVAVASSSHTAPASTSARSAPAAEVAVAATGSAVRASSATTPTASSHTAAGSSDIAASAGAAGDQKEKSSVGGTAEDEKSLDAAELSLLNKLLRASVVESSQSLEVQQKDPNNPLYSAKTFEELHLRKEILSGLYAMGFNRPSKIQETALPLLLADPPVNLIAQSQSGTGKTAAFVLSMISRVDESLAHPQVLVLAPTLELAHQIGDVCESMLRHCPNIHVTFATRGNPQRQATQKQIIIGTPGTTMDWLKRKYFDPHKIRVFVLDEADVMISLQGHQDASVRIKKSLRDDTQMMLFSATYDQPVIDFAKRILRDPVVITLKRQEESLDNIRQLYIEVRNEEDKFESLSHIYGLFSIGQAIVFCHSRKSVTWLATKMSEEGHATAILTGELEANQRMAVLKRFRDHAKERLLITTNVCARGIDIDQVSLVVNYDVPYDVVNQRPDYESYLHRIGRTGRFGKQGLAINFVDGRRSKANLMAIQEHFGRSIERFDLSNTEHVASLEQ